MTQQTEKNTKTFTAAEALAANRLVKLASGSGVSVQYNDQSDSNAYIGVTQNKVANGEMVTIALKTNGRTMIAIASETLSAGATLYAADDGKVSDTSSGNAIGKALEAATADGDEIECILGS